MNAEQQTFAGYQCRNLRRLYDRPTRCRGRAVALVELRIGIHRPTDSPGAKVDKSRPGSALYGTDSARGSLKATGKVFRDRSQRRGGETDQKRFTNGLPTAAKEEITSQTGHNHGDDHCQNLRRISVFLIAALVCGVEDRAKRRVELPEKH